MILANLMIILGKKDEIDIKPSQEKISQFFLSAHDRQAKSTLFFIQKMKSNSFLKVPIFMQFTFYSAFHCGQF
jgi:hypothetical protein